MVALKQVYNKNFQKCKPVPQPSHPFERAGSEHLEEVYDEVATALRIILQGKEIFKLSLIKCANRATMTQERLNSLSTLNINCSLAAITIKQAARGCDF